jgi:hypothetical protein
VSITIVCVGSGDHLTGGFEAVMRRALGAALSTLLATGLLLAGSPAQAEPESPKVAENASTFSPRSPVRVLDTRNGAGPVGPGGVHTLDLSGYVPSTATAVVLNVTGVTPTAATHVSVYPSGTGPATVSNLNLAAGDIRANQVTVKVNADRRIDLYNNSGSIHLVVDLAGHYATGAGAKFTALPPDRRLDTRDGNHPVGSDGTLVLDLTNRIPASATAVTFNLTATGATAATFVTAWPTGTGRPTASNLNLPAGDTRPNLVTVAVGADRKVNLYNLAGSLHLIVDLAGFYTPEYGAHFLPLDPTRLLDTRYGTGGHTGPLGQRASLDLDMAQWSPQTVPRATARAGSAWPPGSGRTGRRRRTCATRSACPARSYGRRPASRRCPRSRSTWWRSRRPSGWSGTGIPCDARYGSSTAGTSTVATTSFAAVRSARHAATPR